jgi:hypothetical protein
MPGRPLTRLLAEVVTARHGLEKCTRKHQPASIGMAGMPLISSLVITSLERRMLFAKSRRDAPNGREAVAQLQNRVFRQAPHVVWTSLRGETVVFDIERGKYESLNEVATSVWEQIVHGATFESIIATLQEEYELPAESSVDQVAVDVAALIARLEKAQVIISEPVVQATRQ